MTTQGSCGPRHPSLVNYLVGNCCSKGCSTSVHTGENTAVDCTPDTWIYLTMNIIWDLKFLGRSLTKQAGDGAFKSQEIM